MLLDLLTTTLEFFYRGKRAVSGTRRKLTPEQVRVGYKTELSHKEREEWLRTRTYSKTKPTNTLPISTKTPTAKD